MQVGQIFRYARPYNPEPVELDNLPNFFHNTFSEGQKLPLLEAGINPIAEVCSDDGVRCPAILISSSPHKIGSAETPWQDYFDPDNGHIRYYGDNKRPDVDPSSPQGNKSLLRQFELHSSPDRNARMLAAPIICFKRVKVGKRAKGNVQFQGFGIITKAERITQYDRLNDTPFSNYVFDFHIFHMNGENEKFYWNWITSRRDSNLSAEETLKKAPASWKSWVEHGAAKLESSRRRVVKLLTYSAQEQKPSKGSKEDKVLSEIYNFYHGRKSRFEALAALVAAKLIGDGGVYRNGWITSASSDGGADFIGRLDIGTGLSTAKIIVLGQAKCEKVDTPTGGNHIARTVARLRRGWVGVYVTTSYFSEAVQREVLEDKYPILLVNGLKLAEVVMEVSHSQGHSSIESFLNAVDSTYESQLAQRNPEEILYD